MKRTFATRLVVLGLAALLLGGCVVLYGYDPQSGLVFQDDFNDSSSGWPIYDQPAGRAGYHDGAYYLEVTAARAQLMAPLPSDFRIPRDIHITVETDAPVNASSEDEYFGVMCRYQDPYNFYFLVISQDGYYGIGKMKAGKAALLNANQLLPADAVVQGGKNLLETVCAGSSLRLTVNGILLGEVDDAEWAAGGIGLLAASGDSGGQQVKFDRLLVQVVDK